ncbi:hypothetical protein D9M72_391380 [compost metagenome]
MLQLVLEPLALGRVLDVHVLNAGGAAVGVTEDAEDVAERKHGLAAETAGGPLAVEVPQGQAVGEDVEVRVLALYVFQRIRVRHEVAAHAVGVDQLLDPGDLVDLVGRVDLQVGAPAHGLVGDAQGLEDFVIEVLRTQQELVYELQELAAAGALDDAVVVRGRQREDLADGVLRDDFLAGALELGRVIQRADADDGGLALGEAGHGVYGADAARVGEGDRGAGVVIGGQLAVAGALDQVLIGVPELGEVEGLRLLDVRHHQQAGAVRLGHVDGDAEVHVCGLDRNGLAVHFVVIDVHGGELGQGPDDGIADQVREGNLAAAGAGQVGVDDHAVVDQQLGRNGADAGGRGNFQAGDHVGSDGLRRSAEDGDDVLFRSGGGLDVLGQLGGDGRGACGFGLLCAVAGNSGRCFLRRCCSRSCLRLGGRGLGGCRLCSCSRCGFRRCCRRRCRCGRSGSYNWKFAGCGVCGSRCARGPVGRRAVTGVEGFEQGPPLGIYRVLVLLVTLVQFVNEPLVSAKFLW